MGFLEKLLRTEEIKLRDKDHAFKAAIGSKLAMYLNSLMEAQDYLRDGNPLEDGYVESYYGGFRIATGITSENIDVIYAHEGKWHDVVEGTHFDQVEMMANLSIKEKLIKVTFIYQEPTKGIITDLFDELVKHTRLKRNNIHRPLLLNKKEERHSHEPVVASEGRLLFEGPDKIGFGIAITNNPDDNEIDSGVDILLKHGEDSFTPDPDKIKRADIFTYTLYFHENDLAEVTRAVEAYTAQERLRESGVVTGR